MITILGASGNVGSKTVENLLAEGKKLRLIGRNATSLQKYADQGAEIRIGDSKDASFLTECFKGSDAVMTMIPGDYSHENFGELQDTLGKAQIEAIKNSGVKKVVMISSVGGHTEEMTGVVAGLARQEVRLQGLEGVDVKILRPTYFMENLFANVGTIKNMGIAGSVIKGDLAMPLIATKDIAQVAASHLANPTFVGKTIQPLLGTKDYTMNEVTSILGNAIGKADLPYVQFPSQDALGAMMGMGMSNSVATGMVNLMEGINAGVFSDEVRNEETTTPTSVEEFAHTFAYVYNL